jgi:hypothetical protein
MAVKSAPYYWLVCDHPDCTNKSTEGGEYDAWSDEHNAIEEAECRDWIVVDGKHYCDGHANEHDPSLMEDCDGSATCDSLAHVEGCFATNPDYKKD